MTDSKQLELEEACEAAYNLYIVELDKLHAAAGKQLRTLLVPPRISPECDGLVAHMTETDCQRLSSQADIVDRAAAEWRASVRQLVQYGVHIKKEGSDE